jgi:hypothetical protein
LVGGVYHKRQSSQRPLQFLKGVREESGMSIDMPWGLAKATSGRRRGGEASMDVSLYLVDEKRGWKSVK